MYHQIARDSGGISFPQILAKAKASKEGIDGCPPAYSRNNTTFS